jgi:uncharacterized circularly permuted ATP-grasp superfamily protein
VLRNVETWRLDTDESLDFVQSNLPDLVLNPVDGSGGKGIVIGRQGSADELVKVRAEVSADRRGWVSPRPVWLSTVPP